MLRDDRVIELRAAEAKPLEGQRDPDQAWFWSEEWQRREREADEDTGAGRVTVHEDAAAMMAHLDATATTSEVRYEWVEIDGGARDPVATDRRALDIQ